MNPNWEAQHGLLKSLYRTVNLSPNDIGYLETHGTGTVAGDIAESKAISSFFQSQTRAFPLYLGSIKSNIGHCESASGIAGLIKTILVLEKGLIPPTINLENFKNGLAFNETINVGSFPEIPMRLFDCKVDSYAINKMA
jgi:acyl transferase domain-containing protein